MKNSAARKKKIFNDPIYGFISLPYEIIFDLVEHPYFQRLRRISQLGLTSVVYSGAQHTRFHHALGAMHLMGQAIEVIRSKGHDITRDEAKAATIAILLHDIGHGPFSHTLEHSLVDGINHETISVLTMERLNEAFDGALTMAMEIFLGTYPKQFLHQLVSSQLDMDRLDYLKRDSFFSGVSEGVVGSDRIIKMLNVVDDQLVVEAKAIYSIEKFIVARRLMYWQVYLHKTVVAAEFLLMNILKRAKAMAAAGTELFCTPAFKTVLYGNFSKADFTTNPEVLEAFLSLDDTDVMASVKVWSQHEDPVLARLCQSLVERRLPRISLQAEAFAEAEIAASRKATASAYGISEADTEYFVFTSTITNSAYNPEHDRINILFRDGTVKDVAEAADLLNISVLSAAVRKHVLCAPKDV
ncbi:MAG: HD domain-containing protein [Bacteroidota bacterium]